MSQDLPSLLHSRARLGVMRWPAGLALSLGLHALVAAAFILVPRIKTEPEEAKVTWISLPASGGVAGGAQAMEQGDPGDRLRRVEEVAPQQQEATKGAATPEAFSSTSRKSGVKGTNPDPTSLGQAPVAAKGAQPTASPSRGAAGSGGGQGLGQGTPGIPGLKVTSGIEGGTGLIDAVDGQFPFLWYLQQVQGRITGSWNRFTTAQGRVQIYFRIRKDGAIEGERIEIPSGNAGLDQSALLAVKRSNPLPPLPDGFDGRTLGVRFWFTYLGK